MKLDELTILASGDRITLYRFAPTGALVLYVAPNTEDCVTDGAVSMTDAEAMELAVAMVQATEGDANRTYGLLENKDGSMFFCGQFFCSPKDAVDYALALIRAAGAKP